MPWQRGWNSMIFKVPCNPNWLKQTRKQVVFSLGQPNGPCFFELIVHEQYHNWI